MNKTQPILLGCSIRIYICITDNPFLCSYIHLTAGVTADDAMTVESPKVAIVSSGK